MQGAWMSRAILVVAVCATGLPAFAAAPPPAVPPPATEAQPAVVTPSPLGAPRPLPPPTKTFPALAAPKLSHRFQFGLAIMPGVGYRFIVPYQDDANCGETGKRVCSGKLPFFLDLQPSLGFAHHWDFLVDVRLGLGKDFTGTREMAFAPGFRYWISPDENLKFFTTIQVAYDVTTQNNRALTHESDFALRNSNGLMYEVMENFGVYAQFGETIGFVRWLRFEIDVGAGVQARLP
jgi:hypothetical protein